MKTKLQQLLFEKGIKQADIARATGITKAAVSLIVTGKVNPSAATLKSMASYLNVSMDELV